MNRRDFIRHSTLAGGALLLQSALPADAVIFSGRKDGKGSIPVNDGLLEGVCDIHLHCRPDSRERSVDEYGFMQDAMRSGYNSRLS